MGNWNPDSKPVVIEPPSAELQRYILSFSEPYFPKEVVDTIKSCYGQIIERLANGYLIDLPVNRIERLQFFVRHWRAVLEPARYESLE